MDDQPAPALDQAPDKSVQNDCLVAPPERLDDGKAAFQPAPRAMHERHGKHALMSFQRLTFEGAYKFVHEAMSLTAACRSLERGHRHGTKTMIGTGCP